MTTPTEIGTPGQNTGSATLTLEITATVPTGADCIVVGAAGYDGAPNTVASVSLGSGGSGAEFTSAVEYDDGNSNANIYYLLASSLDWPGTGALTVTITFDNTQSQARGFMVFLQDVHQTTAVTATGSGTQDGTGVLDLASTISSSTNDLLVGCATSYSGNVVGTGASADNTFFDDGGANETSIYNAATSSSSWMWYEPGVSGSGNQVDIEFDAGLSFGAVVGVSFAGTEVAPTITGTFSNRYASTQASLSGLSWAWFDENVGALAAPTASGAVETTDDSGAFSIDVTGTALTAGQTGTLVVYDSTGGKYGAYRAIVGANGSLRLDNPGLASSYYLDSQSGVIPNIATPPMGPWR